MMNSKEGIYKTVQLKGVLDQEATKLDFTLKKMLPYGEMKANLFKSKSAKVQFRYLVLLKIRCKFLQKAI